MDKPMIKATPIETIRERLLALPGWHVVEDGGCVRIRREFRFKDFYATMSFVNAAAWVAHRMDHHPDMSVHYSRCVVEYTTHDVGGVSELDFEAARRVDALLS
jgi:4a-hydroxytetrahydrobiopterin dehydratase